MQMTNIQGYKSVRGELRFRRILHSMIVGESSCRLTSTLSRNLCHFIAQDDYAKKMNDFYSVVARPLEPREYRMGRAGDAIHDHTI